MNLPAFSLAYAMRQLAFHRSSGDLFMCRVVERMIARHSTTEFMHITVSCGHSGFETERVSRLVFLAS